VSEIRDWCTVIFEQGFRGGLERSIARSFGATWAMTTVTISPGDRRSTETSGGAKGSGDRAFQTSSKTLFEDDGAPVADLAHELLRNSSMFSS